MSILRRISHGRASAPHVDDPRLIRAERIACPRCGTVNCGRHGATVLSSRAVPAHLIFTRGAV